MTVKKIILLSLVFAFSGVVFAEPDTLEQLKNFKKTYLEVCESAGNEQLNLAPICECSVNDMLEHFSPKAILDERERFYVDSYFYETSLYKCRDKLVASQNSVQIDPQP